MTIYTVLSSHDGVVLTHGAHRTLDAALAYAEVIMNHFNKNVGTTGWTVSAGSPTYDYVTKWIDKQRESWVRIDEVDVEPWVEP